MAQVGTFKPEDITIRGQVGRRGLAALLRVQEIVSAHGPYAYLEIGSYLGRTLCPHLLDDDCIAALSIDLRPDVTPDERFELGMYKGVSADDMRSELAKQCGPAHLAKLTTITDSSAWLRKGLAPDRYAMCLIDGEHTNTAVFADFLHVRRAMAEDCVICFDDTHIVYPGIMNAVATLEDARLQHHVIHCKGGVTVVGIGRMATAVRDQLEPGHHLSPDAMVARYRANILGNMVTHDLPSAIARDPELAKRVAAMLDDQSTE